MFQKINKYLFLIIFLTLGITFFAKDNYRGVNDIAPEVLRQPVQREIVPKGVLELTRHGHEYHLELLYDYQISGLVVSKINHSVFGTYEDDKTFPVDVCLIWGSNVSDRLYQNKSISFSHDGRFCLAQCGPDACIKWNEGSNNHLLPKNKEIENKLKSLLKGDQVMMKGKLVNMKAFTITKQGKPSREVGSWNTSTIREDNGGGACEVIYLEEIEILKRPNMIAYFLFRLSGYALILLVIFNVAIIFLPETLGDNGARH